MLSYHEAKMLARKVIFVKPSMTQPCETRGGKAAEACEARLMRLLYHKSECKALGNGETTRIASNTALAVNSCPAAIIAPNSHQLNSFCINNTIRSSEKYCS